LIDSFLIFL